MLMTTVPASLLSAIVTILVLLLFFLMGGRVAQMRTKHSIHAPATSGHPEFDRAFRVHYNTLEQLVMFLPLLWLATAFYHGIGWLPAAFGVVFLIGRILYMQTYMANPQGRGPGVLIGVVANLGLLVLAIIGIVQDWGALNAT
jgi:uncharacterized membrane protein YecN with MAPEG domain